MTGSAGAAAGNLCLAHFRAVITRREISGGVIYFVHVQLKRTAHVRLVALRVLIDSVMSVNMTVLYNKIIMYGCGVNDNAKFSDSFTQA